MAQAGDTLKDVIQNLIDAVEDLLNELIDYDFVAQHGESGDYGDDSCYGQVVITLDELIKELK